MYSASANSQGETGPLNSCESLLALYLEPQTCLKMWALWVGPVIGSAGYLLPTSPALGSDNPLMHPLLRPPVSQVEVTRKQTLRQFCVPNVYEGSPWDQPLGKELGRKHWQRRCRLNAFPWGSLGLK